MNPYSKVIRVYRASNGRFWMEEEDIIKLYPFLSVDSSALIEVEVKKVIKE